MWQKGLDTTLQNVHLMPFHGSPCSLSLTHHVGVAFTLQALFDTCAPGCLEDLLKPLSGDQYMHCTVEPSGHSGYILKYEFLNQYIPLLYAKKKSRKVSSPLTGGYQIVPAFKCIHSQQSKVFHWAGKPVQARPEDVQRSPRWFTREQSRSIFKQLKSAIRPGHNYTIMDTLQEEIVHPSPMRPQTEARLDLEPPILAEVEGSLIKNQYGICTSSPQFENGNLGTVKISTHYIMCRPKKFDINLFTVRKGKDDSSEEEVIILQSKEPDWNHRSQIFELDFGGRVTRDSTKNFQLEIGGQVVSVSAHKCKAIYPNVY